MDTYKQQEYCHLIALIRSFCYSIWGSSLYGQKVRVSYDYTNKSVNVHHEDGYMACYEFGTKRAKLLSVTLSHLGLKRITVIV